VSLQVQVVSPERILWAGDADMVTARTVDGGDISFLTGHSPFVGALEIGQVTIRPTTGADVHFAVHGGFVEVSANNVSVLSDVAEAADQIDVERATRARDAARTALSGAPDDDDAAAALRRADVRLLVAGETPLTAH
jgi:F-type H+-transporting ATPase subunit epsilon